MKSTILLLLSPFFLWPLGLAAQTKKAKVIQFDISDVMNARPVTTLGAGGLTAWTTGIDGGGKADGYLTRSAAAFNKQDSAHALPDNALFPANSCHPEIQLHYSNQDSVDYQACAIPLSDTVRFFVPEGKYAELYFALTSAEGASNLNIELVYDSGSEIKHILLPDYYQDLPENSPNLCYLAHDLAKWGPHNQMTEKNHHNIDVLKIIPDAKRTLTSIMISKGNDGYLVFWGAAGR